MNQRRVAGLFLLAAGCGKYAVPYDFVPQVLQQDFAIQMGDLRRAFPIDLTKDPKFPAQVAYARIAPIVQVKEVHYWTPQNSLTFATPLIDLYVGPKGTEKKTDPGVRKIGALDPIAAHERTACVTGNPPGTVYSACRANLTEEGKALLGGFAQNFKTPFVLLLLGPVTAPAPAGKIDLVIQPTIEFEIPLT